MFHRSVLLLLLLGCFQVLVTANSGAHGADLCCFEFHKNPIPVIKLKDFEETRAECTNPGIIFTTEKNLRVCSDPEIPWVQRALGILKSRNQTQSST